MNHVVHDGVLDSHADRHDEDSGRHGEDNGHHAGDSAHHVEDNDPHGDGLGNVDGVDLMHFQSHSKWDQNDAVNIRIQFDENKYIEKR